MKIVSFTMVNNESEIIESFIRYNYNFVDQMVIIDNGCTDNTITIVNKLVNEGFNIVVFDESLEAYNQFRLDNKYLTKIIDEFDADIIIPLDADEFLTGENNPRDIIEKLALDRIYYVNWQWFVMTPNDDENELFIPKRMQYCIEKKAWNYSDGAKVTKTIIPASYYKDMHLTLSMGHHTVFGNPKCKIEELSNLWLAHYRAISELQIVSKICCYTMRDIATMDNNHETAQRTNQMAMIERGENMKDVAIDVSRGGYGEKSIFSPINLSYCNKNSLDIKYASLSNETLEARVMKTGQEMAIKAYNIERNIKEKPFLKPVIFVLDGVKEGECVNPDPSNKLTILTERFNVRGYITIRPEIKFLKTNYRLIVTPEVVKFLPHSYIVIPPTMDFQKTMNELVDHGANSKEIISYSEYINKIGIFGVIFSYIIFVPNMISRVRKYLVRNGLSNTLTKIKKRIGA